LNATRLGTGKIDSTDEKCKPTEKKRKPSYNVEKEKKEKGIAKDRIKASSAVEDIPRREKL